MTTTSLPAPISRFRRFLHLPPIRILMGVAVCMAVPTGVNHMVMKPLLAMSSLEAGLANTLRYGLVTVFLLATYILWFRRTEHRRISELALGGVGRFGVPAFLGGFGLLSLTLAPVAILGYYRTAGAGPLPVLLTSFITLFLLATLEEVLFRGILYRIVEESTGTDLALLISALLFGAGHILNANANLVSVLAAGTGGVLVGILFTLTRSLWAPIFLHVGWNYAQVFFGLRLSGSDEFGVFLHGSLEGPALLTGGEFGVENSIFAILACFVAAAVLYWRIVRTGKLVRRGRPETALVA